MVKALHDDDYATLEVNHHPEIEPDAALSEVVLLDLLDALVEERDRAPAAEVLGGNQTLAVCRGCRQASRRVRQALPEFRNASGAGGASALAEGGRSSMTVNDGTGSNLHGCPASV